MKVKWIYGTDFSKSDDWNAETVMKRKPDGSFEIHDTYRWKTSIDLSKDAYRVKDATAPAQ